jgi:hypothetical protein
VRWYLPRGVHKSVSPEWKRRMQAQYARLLLRLKAGAAHPGPATCPRGR